MQESIRIEKAALDETANGDIILRGVVHPDSLRQIKADTYQREILPLTACKSLVKAIVERGKIPDITLGMRGGDFTERGGAFHLKDPVYVIDGLQRSSTAIRLMESGDQPAPHLGAIIYFNTTQESEAELFRILNTSRVRLSPNILIRNQREHNIAIELILDICRDTSFALYDRVSWQQSMKRYDIINGATLLSTAGVLHSSIASGLNAFRWQDQAERLALMLRDKIQRKAFRANIIEFFDVLDVAFGVRDVAYKGGATHLKGGFLSSFAFMIASHRTFWDQNWRMTIAPDVARKLKTFPLNDPLVRAACSGGRVRDSLAQLIAEHINSGRRTKRLVPFRSVQKMEEE